jgi:NADH-ubiquinone oxidoreductase chain 1
MLIQLLVILIWSVAILLCVALLTLLERKLLGSLQRRLGPDTVGYVGILQPIADAVKLLTKQTSSTYNSSFSIFYIAPAWALIIVLTGWGILTKLYINNYYTYLSSLDNILIDYGWLSLLAVLSLSIYSVLLLGWSANSSYSLAGSLRSSAALISYELILATSALLPMVLSQSYSLIELINNQSIVLYIIPLLPVFLIFIISVLAETSRVPFDLVEAIINYQTSAVYPNESHLKYLFYSVGIE